MAADRLPDPTEEFCAHGCGDDATVQHADGRMLCYPCYRTETGGDNERLPGCPTCSPAPVSAAVVSPEPICPGCKRPVSECRADDVDDSLFAAVSPAEAAEPYVISDERLAEIRGLINWKQSGWQTIPTPGTTVYDLAGALEDLLAEREKRDHAR